MLADLPDASWKLPQEEIARRRDCRKERVVSIDPLGSKDIDDALHVKQLPKGRFQVIFLLGKLNFIGRSPYRRCELFCKGK